MAVRSRTEAFCVVVLAVLCIAGARTAWAQGRIDDRLELWGGGSHGSVSEDGQVISLYLDRDSGSGFRSKDMFMYARTDLQMKLVPNNSAGIVTTCYFMSEGNWGNHDEIDLEFLGNLSGQPYTLHTNIYTNGTGHKEQQFRLWFDPTTDFHTYSIVWTPLHILVLVDGTPIRELKNHEDKGVAYPSSQPMRLYGSLWNADDWATQGGRVKTDWSAAPFVAHYRNFTATTAASSSSGPGGYGGYYDQEMDATAQQSMKWARDTYMVYNYCADATRFPGGAPPECYMP